MASIRELLARLVQSVDAPDPQRAAQLWATYRGGGPEAEAAFATLMAWYGGLIYRRVRGFVRPDAADDVFQEVVIRLHRHRHRLPDFDYALRWARAVAATLSLRALRTDRRRQARELVRATDGSAAPPEPLSELQESLRAAVARLPDREREVIALVFFEGLTRQSAAAALGVHRDTLAKRLDSALGRLRAALPAAVLAALGGSAVVDTALASLPAGPAHLAGLVAAAWERAGKPVGLPSWFSGTAAKVGVMVAVGGLASTAGFVLLWSALMPPSPAGVRLGVERLDDRITPSFGTGGFVTTDIAGSDGEQGRAVAVQTDGKIVAAGPGGVVRYNIDGSLDTTFNAAGTQPGVLPIADPLFDLAVQSDGKILVAGQTVVKNKTVALLQRINTNGTPDTTFGTSGRATTDFGRANDPDNLRKITVQSDGKVVAVARINSHQWGVARFTTGGALDRTFDGDGWLTTTVVASKNATVTDVAVQSDGSIVAIGTVFMGAPTYADMAVVRYESNGAIDTDFGTNGRVTLDFTGEHQKAGVSSDEAHAVALGADGEIVIAGYELNRTDGLLARLTADGTPDTTFGGNGRVVVLTPPLTVNGNTYNPPVNFTDVGLQADGRIVAWSVWLADDAGHPAAVVRVNTDGTLDTTFGEGGAAYVQWPGGGQKDPNYGGIALQSDGKIVVVGGHYDSSGSYFDLARFNADGTLDV